MARRIFSRHLQERFLSLCSVSAKASTILEFFTRFCPQKYFFNDFWSNFLIVDTSFISTCVWRLRISTMTKFKITIYRWKKELHTNRKSRCKHLQHLHGLFPTFQQKTILKDRQVKHAITNFKFGGEFAKASRLIEQVNCISWKKRLKDSKISMREDLQTRNFVAIWTNG